MKKKHILLFPKGDNINKYSTISDEEFEYWNKFENQTLEVGVDVLAEWTCNAKKVKCYGLRTLKTSQPDRKTERTDYITAQNDVLTPTDFNYGYLGFDGWRRDYDVQEGNWINLTTQGTSIFVPPASQFLGTGQGIWALYNNKCYYINRTLSSNRELFRAEILSVSKTKIEEKFFYFSGFSSNTNHLVYTHTIEETFY
jgi:hypothetical protein